MNLNVYFSQIAPESLLFDFSIHTKQQCATMLGGCGGLWRTLNAKVRALKKMKIPTNFANKCSINEDLNMKTM